MRIGKQDDAKTAIASSITVQGQDLVGDLIGQIDVTDHFWLLVYGMRPDDRQKAMTNAYPVAIAEHGLVPTYRPRV